MIADINLAAEKVSLMLSSPLKMSVCKFNEEETTSSRKLNVQLGTNLHQRVARSAAESGLSLNSWIMQALEKSVSE